ncbi:MAG TPA: flavin reductase family protein [Bacteroidetes bacterium]|nr:flavin reductase family protein [Bacteroidota bacterium]
MRQPFKKSQIDVFESLNVTGKAIKQGVLLTTRWNNRVNSMTISWGQVGIEWNRPVFTAFVRGSRYTYEMLLHHGEFTVNIPSGGNVEKILNFCGTRSGRDTDKIRELGLTLVEGEKVSVPGIAELPITLECKVIYRQMQDPKAIPHHILEEFYPQHRSGDPSMTGRDIHTMFYGEMVNSYLIENGK